MREIAGMGMAGELRGTSDAVRLIQAFYAMMVRLAARLDIDPDRPHPLRKIASTR